MFLAKMAKTLCLGAILFSLMITIGCNKRPTTVSVSGKVLIDGKPLEYGTVIFTPNGGRMSSSTLDKEGRFSLTCFTPKDGALIGKHNIQVFANESINETSAWIHAPIKYASAQTSELSEEIKGATDSIVINLTWKGSGHDQSYKETYAPDIDPVLDRKMKKQEKKSVNMSQIN